MPSVQSRIFPINWATAANGAVDDTNPVPKAAIQSITMAVRIGRDDAATAGAIGYVQEFNWSMRRDAQPIHQIEPIPDNTFGSQVGLGTNLNFTTSKFWPGEPVEVIPGKVGGVEIRLGKYALYSCNLLRSTLKLAGAGTEDATPTSDIHYTGTGQNEYVSLIQQTRPIYIYQYFLSPISGQPVFGRVFEECWFTDIGETIPTAETNMAILENGTLLATRIRPVLKKI